MEKINRIIQEELKYLLEGISFSDENTGHHNGQSDMISRMIIDGKQVAYVQYTKYDDKIYIQYIEANEKGKGYGVKLMDHLASQYGYENLERTSLTPDGVKMREKLDKKHNFNYEKHIENQSTHINPFDIDKIKDPIVKSFLKDNVKIGYEAAWAKWLKNDEFNEFLQNHHDIDMNDVSEISKWVKGSKDNNNGPEDETPYYVIQDFNKLIGKEMVKETIEEDYPVSFDMEHFKTINSFNDRVQYCEEHLQRISSGSGRIAYKIDEEKVLKLAKNKKGVAQNEAEIEGQDGYVTIFAKTFEYHPNYLWL